MTPEFLLTTLVIVATPGTGVVYTLAAGLARGARASLVAAAGCTLGIVPHMLAALTGLAALLHASGVAFAALKYLGVAYLLYMAWATIRERGALQLRGDPSPRSAVRVIVSGILVNLLNPKLTLFFFAFLPLFVDPSDPHSPALMVQLSVVFMGATFVVFAGYGLLAARLRDSVASRPQVVQWLRRVFAGSFAVLGARLALTDR
jgi:threonine/homoserine/homoserine lactone efflux protein